MQLHYLEEVRQKDKRHKISRMWSLTSNTDEPICGDGQGGLACCSLWGRKESDTTEQLHFHFSLSCFGEGNGSPLQCSCLENPRDGGSLVGCHLWGHTESDTIERLNWTELMKWKQNQNMENRLVVAKAEGSGRGGLGV